MRTKARFMPPILVRRGVNPPAGAVVPATPTGLAQSGPGLVWTDNANNETGYRVEESATGIGGWSTVAGSLPANTESWAGPVSAGTFYRVIADNPAGDSDPSNVIEAEPLPYEGARLAYSVRDLGLGAAYAMRVRRSSDNAEQNIGFDENGDLDETALTTFVGGANGFIAILYDQSGNDDHMLAVGNGPYIINAGAVTKQNGIPALEGFSSSNYLELSGATVGIATRSWSLVCTQTSTAPDKGAFGFKPGGGGNDWGNNDSFVFQGNNPSPNNKHFYIAGGASAGYFIAQGVSADGVMPFGHYFEAVDAGNGELWWDGNSVGTDSHGSFSANNTTAMRIGVRWQGSNANPWNGNTQELVYWEDDKSADLTDINDDVSSYFGTP